MVRIAVALSPPHWSPPWCGDLAGRAPGQAAELRSQRASINSSGSLNAEATELIEDNYYRRVDHSALNDSSIGGMVRGLRHHFHDRFSEYFSPETLDGFNEEIDGHFSGVGMEVTPLKRGLGVVKVFHGRAGGPGQDQSGRSDRLGQRSLDRR